MVSKSICAETIITGYARIIDGDTIVVDGKRVRLHGIDAPENKQMCLDKNGLVYACGKATTKALRDFTTQTIIKCLSESRDRYKRLIAICYGRGTNINTWLVKNGWAVAYAKYSSDYIQQELEAKQAKRGLWAGSFIMPWQWRRGDRLISKNIIRKNHNESHWWRF